MTNRLRTHYLRFDTRINAIKSIINPFQEQLDSIVEICKKDDFDYWDSIYADNTEHLIGTVFIVLQNYINSSISDLYPELSQLHLNYALDKKIRRDSKTTRIELIIALANYYKHRDLPSKLHKYTTNPLEDLKIDYKVIYNLEDEEFRYKMGADSPVFNGLGILTEKWELNNLIEIVSEWRENLWIREEKTIK